MVYPGRRCALPWARLFKPVGLSKPLALRAIERERIGYQSSRPAGCRTRALRAIDHLALRAVEHWPLGLGDKFRLAFAIRPEWGSDSSAQGRAKRRPELDGEDPPKPWKGGTRVVPPLQADGAWRFGWDVRSQGVALGCHCSPRWGIVADSVGALRAESVGLTLLARRQYYVSPIRARCCSLPLAP